MKLNWDVLVVQNKKPYVGGVWIFSGTTQHSVYNIYSLLLQL